jgi:catechol-2,3-dioxygenase
MGRALTLHVSVLTALTIIRPTLHHYGLTTANLKAMSEWYATVLGMSVVFEKTGRILNCSQPHFC